MVREPDVASHFGPLNHQSYVPSGSPVVTVKKPLASVAAVKLYGAPAAHKVRVPVMPELCVLGWVIPCQVRCPTSAGEGVGVRVEVTVKVGVEVYGGQLG